jgi:RNA polymerase sigma-70 factor, ECF subfamily
MAIEGFIQQHKTRKSDITAFESLFRKYYADLVNYSCRLTRDMDAAEEIVQEFFYNYWKHRKEINIKFSLRAYMYRAIRNNTLNYLEAVSVRRKYADRVLSRSTAYGGYEDSSVELAELHERIDRILDELPERCRVIFCMSRFDGLKYEEIAERLSISVKTVEVNIGKALKLLRRKLEKTSSK